MKYKILCDVCLELKYCVGTYENDSSHICGSSDKKAPQKGKSQQALMKNSSALGPRFYLIIMLCIMRIATLLHKMGDVPAFFA